MDKEMIVFAGLIVLVGLIFFSVDKWQKAEKKLKKAKKKLEEYEQANSSDSPSWTPVAKQIVLLYQLIDWLIRSLDKKINLFISELICLTHGLLGKAYFFFIVERVFSQAATQSAFPEMCTL